MKLCTLTDEYSLSHQKYHNSAFPILRVNSNASTKLQHLSSHLE